MPKKPAHRCCERFVRAAGATRPTTRPKHFEELKKSALASLQLAEPVLRKHKVKLGVENHKDWRAPNWWIC